MKTLLAILACAGDNDRLKRHWPYFKLTGFAILGCGTVDGQVEWPDPISQLNTGKLGRKMTPAGSSIFGLVEQELDIWKYFLDHPQYDSVCVVEADNLFVRRPPAHPGHGLYLVTLLPNYSKPGIFKTPYYFSTPRWADRKCAEQLYRHGRLMFQAGDHEHYISDRFPAWICQKHHLPWLAQPAWSPSPFAWGGNFDEVWVRDARAAIQTGAYCLHSVKTPAQLDALKDLLPLTNEELHRRNVQAIARDLRTLGGNAMADKLEAQCP